MDEIKRGTLGKVYYDPPDTNDVIEFDDIAYKDPEYKVEIINPHHYPSANLEETLNSGWHLYNWIVCHPYVMLFFSREKESAE